MKHSYFDLFNVIKYVFLFDHCCQFYMSLFATYLCLSHHILHWAFEGIGVSGKTNASIFIIYIEFLLALFHKTFYCNHQPFGKCTSQNFPNLQSKRCTYNNYKFVINRCVKIYGIGPRVHCNKLQLQHKSLLWSLEEFWLASKFLHPIRVIKIMHQTFILLFCWLIN